MPKVRVAGGGQQVTPMGPFSHDNHILGMVAPLVGAATIVLFDVYLDSIPWFLGLLTQMPLIAAALTCPWRTSFVGAGVVAMGYFDWRVQKSPESLDSLPQEAFVTQMVLLIAACMVAIVLSWHRRRNASRMAAMVQIAEASQLAILRPVPGRVGHIKCASTYVSASKLANIGGDLIEVLNTGDRVRAIIGDVRGKGMDAVQLSGRVLGAFREYAWTAQSLPDLVEALDASVARVAAPEDFVTALLLEVEPDGTTALVSCGHPSPYLVTKTSGQQSESVPVREVDVEPGQPLGLCIDPPKVTIFKWPPRTRLVLVTDGLLETRRPVRGRARNGDEFIAAAEVIGQNLASADLTVGLNKLVMDVGRWSKGKMTDDMAILVLEHSEEIVPAQRQPLPLSPLPGDKTM